MMDLTLASIADVDISVEPSRNHVGARHTPRTQSNAGAVYPTPASNPTVGYMYMPPFTFRTSPVM